MIFKFICIVYYILYVVCFNFMLYNYISIYMTIYRYRYIYTIKNILKYIYKIMNSFFFIKKFFRINLKLIHKLPRVYICDPLTFLGIRKKSNFQILSYINQKTKDSYSNNSDKSKFNEEQENKRTQTALLAIPLSFFIVEMYNKTLKSENNHTLNDSIIDNSIKKPYLGCSIRSKKGQGMQVVLIKSDSPAEKAGLQVGDVIISINGIKTNSINEYFAAVGLESGFKKIVIYRDNQNDPIEVIVYFE